MSDQAVLLDLRGLNCPLPVLKARQKLARMNAGDVLHVEATDPMSAIDIPHMCSEDGHCLLSSTQEGRLLRFEIRRGGLHKRELPHEEA
ncbi:sulfurtransferase TusA family protein [Polycladidibacter hongkongensis]|uniref:sulfurtransferase TusA family protein n=1 Tax=Polycladidibacter hongkongensis TaxID=1647556 RepID=UPI0008332F18|nr:sulfurtransferase TusA family protein [Pseudovibrio hongkongensis]